MITSDPITGIGLHAVGGASASTCYLPYHKTKKWSWTSFWLVQALFAWIVIPGLLAIITVPDFFSILHNAPAHILAGTFLLGGIYGFGGMSFGFATRHIGYSLTYTISIGISAVLGTVIPLLVKHHLIEYFGGPGGEIILAGMIIAIIGVCLCGWAGFRKEKEVSKDISFNIRAGLTLAIIAGVLSAVFNMSLEYGKPIADMAAVNGAGIFEGNAKLIVSTSGCFLVNLIWFLTLAIKHGNLKEMTTKSGRSGKQLFTNVCLSALAGTLWSVQFFFYGLGHVKMGKFQFASWVIHMSMLIFFSFIVGIIMKEWKNVSKITYTILIIALLVLCASFFIMTYGSW